MALIVKTIGSSGRDYATLALWIASIPANLVTDGNSYEGDCYNDSEFTGTGTMLTIPATTTDATHTLTLTTGAGQSFQDNAGVRSSALKYNVSNGVGIRKTDNYAQLINMTGAVDYFTISKLQFSRSNSGSGVSILAMAAACNHLLLKDIVSEVSGTGTSTVYAWAIAGSSTAVVANVLCICRNSQAAPAFQGGGGDTLFIGCGAVRPSDLTAAGTGFQRTYGSPVLQSCYSFGFTAATAGTWGTSKNNATEQASITGSAAQTSVTYNSSTPFTNAADSTLDFRAIAATSLAANGFKDATNAPADISGLTRSATPTIGVWELAGAAGPPPGQFPRVATLLPFLPAVWRWRRFQEKLCLR